MSRFIILFLIFLIVWFLFQAFTIYKRIRQRRREFFQSYHSFTKQKYPFKDIEDADYEDITPRKPDE